MPGASEGCVQTQVISEGFNLPRMRIADCEDLLKRDDVCLQTLEYFLYAFDGYASVHSTGFVDVVRDDPHKEILPRSRGRSFTPELVQSDARSAFDKSRGAAEDLSHGRAKRKRDSAQHQEKPVVSGRSGTSAA